MSAIAGLSHRPRLLGAAARLLLVLVVALAALQAAQPLHLHRAATAGLYNEQHVLDALDSIGGDLPLPDAPATPPGDAVSGYSADAAGARPSTPSPRSADSRAPPLA